MKQKRHSTFLGAAFFGLGILFILGQLGALINRSVRNEKGGTAGTVIFLVLAVLAIGIAWLLGTPKRFSKMACPQCGSVTEPADKLRGSTGIEFLLFLLMIIPGLIYSVWRYGGDRAHCSSCGATGLLPLDSPKGKEIAARAEASA